MICDICGLDHSIDPKNAFKKHYKIELHEARERAINPNKPIITYDKVAYNCAMIILLLVICFFYIVTKAFKGN